jgi:hypothetical protein
LNVGDNSGTNAAGIQGGDAFCGYGEYKTENGWDGMILFGGEEGNSAPRAKSRHKHHSAFYLLGIAMPAAPHGEVKCPPSYFTQIEVTAGLGGGSRLGFNPGELLDFILGWVGFDIYGDDLASRQNETESNPTVHRTAQALACGRRIRCRRPERGAVVAGVR